MKTTFLLLLALLLTACSLVSGPAATPAPAETLEVPTGAPSAAPATQPAPPQFTSTPAPSATASPMMVATETVVSKSALTEPSVVERFPYYMGEDGLGYGTTFLALPGGQAWEATTGGGVRVYDSQDMSVLKSLDLGGFENALARLVGDAQYVWALFYTQVDGVDVAKLFRIARADYRFEQVDLPENCTYEACAWSILRIDGDILWLGGYDELWGLDRVTMEPVTQFVVSEQAGTFMPSEVIDLDVTGDGQVWSLFCTDTCYIVILDRQKLLDGADQEPQFISFTNATVQFVTNVGGVMVAGEDLSGINESQPAVLYRLDETGVELGPQDGIELPAELDFYILEGMNLASDGRYLWIVNEGGRKLFWYDPQAQEVAGVLQVYPGDDPTTEDPNMIMSISFDGQHLWASGSEVLRVALPWAE